MITDLLAAEPHGVWTVAQLCQLAYPKQRVEKKHRVAMWRAIHHIELGPVWQLTERTDTESYLFNASSEESTLRLAFNRDRTRTYRKVGFEEWKQDAEHIEYAREAVQAFWRYHHASPIEKIDIDIAHAQKGLEFWQNSDLDLGSTYFLKRIAELNKRKAELTALASPPLPASN